MGRPRADLDDYLDWQARLESFRASDRKLLLSLGFRPSTLATEPFWDIVRDYCELLLDHSSRRISATCHCLRGRFWDGSDEKTDARLCLQAREFDQLLEMGSTIAYAGGIARHHPATSGCTTEPRLSDCGSQKMFANDDDLEQLIEGLRRGERDATFLFWNRYGPMLERLVDRNLARGMRRRFGPEDVVQSACRTFFRRAQAGEFEISDSDSLWRLLCAITLTKLRQQARFHGQQKRNLQQERHLDSVDHAEKPKMPPIADQGSSPDEAVEFSDQLRSLIESLEEKDREVLELKLQDLDNEEVAKRLSCAERTVRRRLQRIEAILVKSLDEAG